MSSQAEFKPMNEERDGLFVPIRSPLCTAVSGHAAKQRQSRGAVASWIMLVAAQSEKGLEENERTNQT